MKRLLIGLAAFAALAMAGSPERPHISRVEVANLEKIINTQLAGMFPDEPWLILGFTRGIYIDGVGVVFSADVNLATGPTVSPFNPSLPKEVVAAHHDKKVSRLPKLRDTMYAIVRSLTTFLPGMPADEQVVFAVTLYRYPWEIPNGIPTQIVMHVQRAKLLEAVAKNTPMNSTVVSQEY